MLSQSEEITGKIWKVAKVYQTGNPVTLSKRKGKGSSRFSAGALIGDTVKLTINTTSQVLLLLVVLKRNKGYLLVDTSKFANGNTQHSGNQSLLLLKTIKKKSGY